ncbi:MAG: ATP-binding protein, partial [Thermoanaerobaculia bacterium]
MANDVAAYEKLGAFYLGRPYDPARGTTNPAPLLYDSRDLLTHAVCVGMTGSGKTGLLIGLLEEAAIDGIPSLVIDPKGDLANLLLTFPELRPADFAPWVDPDAAARAGVTVDVFAAQEAEAWRAGLASWDQTGERIARLRAAADFAIYTPGSEAGLQVSILSSLDAPPAEVVADGDALRERIGTVVSSLLSLLDIESDPIQGREHILLASVFDAAWREGRGLDLAALIQQIQKPPIERIGVMDLETFYPAKERFGLSLALNNLLGSPGFAAWLRGEPLDVDRLLYSPAGKPRVAVFSIAHLADKERMFFAALLFNQTLGWMRSKPGTTSLRALLAMDEVFGYMPPVAEPPSKRPLLTLLKQARAFGLGLVLATQNPVDLDYKGLANVGTWFLGRLQTERDKQRLMDGLEGAAGAGFDRAQTEQILSGLAGRTFLLHDVHADQPVLFQTRWTLSYLRGPLTRPEIKRLMDPLKSGSPAEAGPQPATAPAASVPAG